MLMWRLINSGCCSGNENTALTKAIIETCEMGLHEGTLRFFQFDGSYVSVGCYQDIEREVRVPYCKTKGVGVIRRLSGGGVAYLNRDAISWQFIASKNALSLGDSREFVVVIGRAIALGFRTLGLNATYREPGIIEVDEKLLFRINSLETPNTIFCEGYIPKHTDIGDMLRSLRIPTEKLSNKEEAAYKSRNTALCWLCGETLSGDVVREALTKAISEELGICFHPTNITEQEHEFSVQCRHADEIAATSINALGYELVAHRRGKNGDIKAVIVIDSSGSKICAARITGDFYVYPGNTIVNLQERLVGLAASSRVVDQVVDECIADSRISGLSAEDFRHVICDALRKQTFSSVGAYPHEFSDMYYVGGLVPENLPYLMKTVYMPLLLPYCAKEASCRLRYTEGCVCCGRCDVGEAYSLAKQYDVRPITIQNYEMLEDSLRSMKASGITMFIGTCCEEFINKHYKDFEEIGMPGMLVGIDNSTCYELGDSDAAYKGLFQKQTQLKLDLLERIFKNFMVK